MATVISNSPKETESHGAAWGEILEPGTVLLLTGDLGAGKTQWVRGLARGLGSSARVHSPTFAIVNLYPDGRLPLAHLDLYRLRSPDEFMEAGIVEYLQPEGVAVIEWGEKLLQPGPDGGAAVVSESDFPANVRRIRIEVVTDTQRRIVYEDPGA